MTLEYDFHRPGASVLLDKELLGGRGMVLEDVSMSPAPGFLRGRSLLTLLELSPSELRGLITMAARLKVERTQRVFPRRLGGRNVALLFEKASVRTRCAFVVAATEEGAHAETLSAGDIHLGTKEDVRDTARVLSRYFDGIEFRGYHQGTVEALARNASVPVWNGLTDEHHPTQALADLLTLRESFDRALHPEGLRGLKVCYLGDAANNTCTSLMIACATAGVNFVMSGPEEYLPGPVLLRRASQLAAENGGNVSIERLPHRAVQGAHALYTDVYISMGEETKPYAQAKLAALAPWRLDGELLKATGREDTIVLHCLPANKGVEITEEVFESPASRVFEQAENRLHTIKALMLATMS
jgi:ornithine carbamoyltransferase